jgi:hypothetical protein
MNWEVYSEGTKPNKRMKCYVCSAPVRSRGEMDHFPIPKRLGGTKVMPICINCHDDKDRHQFKIDSEDGFNCALSLWEKATTEERIMLAKLYTILLDQVSFIERYLENK